MSPPSRWRNFGRLLLAGLFLLGVQGCAEPDDAGPDTQYDAGALPISDLVSEFRTLTRLSRNVENVLAEQCMREQGFPAFEVPWNDGVERPDDWVQLNRWTPYQLDEDMAREVGYEASLIASLEESPNPRFEVLETMTDGERAAWDLAWWGPPSDEVFSLDEPSPIAGGCLGVAAREVLNGNDENSRAAEGLRAAQQLQSEADSRLEDHDAPKKALAAWSDCMQESGFAVRDPQASYELGIEHRNNADVSAEVALATTDAACQRSSKLHEIMIRTISDIEIDLIGGAEGSSFSLWYLENHEAIVDGIQKASNTAGITLPTE